jgi:hypothetical protein
MKYEIINAPNKFKKKDLLVGTHAWAKYFAWVYF